MFVVTTIRMHNILRSVQYIFYIQTALEAVVLEEGCCKRATKYPLQELLVVKPFIVVPWIQQGMRIVMEEVM